MSKLSYFENIFLERADTRSESHYHDWCCPRFECRQDNVVGCEICLRTLVSRGSSASCSTSTTSPVEQGWVPLKLLCKPLHRERFGMFATESASVVMRFYMARKTSLEKCIMPLNETEEYGTSVYCFYFVHCFYVVYFTVRFRKQTYRVIRGKFLTNLLIL